MNANATVDVMAGGYLHKEVPVFSRLALDEQRCQKPGCHCDSSTIIIRCEEHPMAAVWATWCKKPGVLLLVCSEEGCGGIVGAMRCGSEA